jgi:hypothetical protein
MCHRCRDRGGEIQESELSGTEDPSALARAKIASTGKSYA